LLLTNPTAARTFEKTFFSLPPVTASSPALADGQADEAEVGEDRQSFREWLDDVVIPTLMVARAMPRIIWLVPRLRSIEQLKEHLYTTAVQRGLKGWQATANPGKNACG
jgi:hypothetical protein